MIDADCSSSYCADLLFPAHDGKTAEIRRQTNYIRQISLQMKVLAEATNLSGLTEILERIILEAENITHEQMHDDTSARTRYLKLKCGRLEGSGRLSKF
ncbi:hypothetical protein [Beijerinckia indica]|uniref:Uncharacterized protein n=1 Tax=Beijerinckia indica subsp. indica (strain ATCC 9039 / DSM 1715 / NCIMB 8712) TaxID=395963 RepID=B2IHA4_BEII9|nr:hypothetical protein [Beijerinckia indica]ACB95889.1 hypothetical protein Bind_2273 [Beijerinckia indica subsp. indica ATCC 9039]